MGSRLRSSSTCTTHRGTSWTPTSGRAPWGSRARQRSSGCWPARPTSTTSLAPTCVYHLIPLVDKTTSVLVPYNGKKRRWAPRPSVTDHIVNAFRYLEHSHPGLLTLRPFIFIFPYASVYDNIYQLVFDKKITLVLLPFHLCACPDSTGNSSAATINPFVRAMNVNVLHYAPYTVAIYLDHGSMIPTDPGLLPSVAVYFLCRGNDREVLAYAVRIAENRVVGLTVIRPVLPAKMVVLTV